MSETRTPDPRCTTCGGRGWYTYYADAHSGDMPESCDCWRRSTPQRPDNVVHVDFKRK